MFRKGCQSAAEASESDYMRERVKPFPTILKYLDGFAADEF